MLQPIPINKLEAIGTNTHRSGWPYALQALQPLYGDSGPLFVDFVEQIFSYHPLDRPIVRPWVGVFHHPAMAPAFLHRVQPPAECILELPLFKQSVHNLKLAITLSAPLAEYLQQHLDVPAISLLMPSETPEQLFDLDRYLENETKNVIQIGVTYRNTSAIDQLDLSTRFVKNKLLLDRDWAHNYADYIARIWRWQHSLNAWDKLPGSRENIGSVNMLSRLSDQQYDEMLSDSIVFVEYFAAAATNTVVECIVRNTPIVINRLPALEEYLGKDYPLFYENFDTAKRLFETDRIKAAHEYLKTLDKSCYTAEYFQKCFSEAVKQALP